MPDSGLLDRLPERLRGRIRVCDEPHPKLGTPCWICEGRSTSNGYARVGWQGREPVVHRVVWEVAGLDIPEDRPILDHLCKVRRCCNPEHLEPVTHQENTLRGDAILFKPHKPNENSLPALNGSI